MTRWGRKRRRAKKTEKLKDKEEEWSEELADKNNRKGRRERWNEVVEEEGTDERENLEEVRRKKIRSVDSSVKSAEQWRSVDEGKIDRVFERRISQGLRWSKWWQSITEVRTAERRLDEKRDERRRLMKAWCWDYRRISAIEIMNEGAWLKVMKDWSAAGWNTVDILYPRLLHYFCISGIRRMSMVRAPIL